MRSSNMAPSLSLRHMAFLLRTWLCYARVPHPGTKGSCGERLAIFSPVVHHQAPLCEELASPVCRLGLVRDEMRERRFGDFARVIGLLADPIPERRAKPVHCVGLFHFFEKFGQRHV